MVEFGVFVVLLSFVGWVKLAALHLVLLGSLIFELSLHVEILRSQANPTKVVPARRLTQPTELKFEVHNLFTHTSKSFLIVSQFTCKFALTAGSASASSKKMRLRITCPISR